jgi:hypothetical protein
MAQDGRMLELGLEAKGKVMPTLTKPWTPEKENKLHELSLGAKSVDAIAKLLNRTASGGTSTRK